MKLIDKVHRYIEEYKMLDEHDTVVAGVSGGADSVCLLDVLCFFKTSYKLRIIVVHVNHCIRGEEADQDEEYVRQLCLERGIGFVSKHIKVSDYARENKITEEEAGRAARYGLFEETASTVKNGNCRIAVAHNMNDNSETMLFNLFRGSGLAGLAGIQPVNDRIIRPLLCVSRQEIENYLSERNLQYKTDRTNLADDYTRNKIRHNIIPYAVENINERTVEHMFMTSEMISQTESFMASYTRSCMKNMITYHEEKVELDTRLLKAEEDIIQRRIAREAVIYVTGCMKDITYKHIEDVLDIAFGQTGRRLMLPYDVEVSKSYDTLHINKKAVAGCDGNADEALEKELSFDTEYFLPELNKYLKLELKNYKKNEKIPKNNYTKWFDYDKIYNVILLRNRRQDDYIQINPEGGTKSLKKLFMDLKIDREARDKQPLLTDGSHVLWVIGLRSTEACRIDESTSKVLVASIYDGMTNNTLL